MLTTLDNATPVFIDISTHPSPARYMSTISLLDPSTFALLAMILSFLSWDFHERVLQEGHLRGSLAVLENHSCPHMQHVLMVDSPCQ